MVNKSALKKILVTDCGSTTTKALLFEKTTQGWRQTSRGEAPTTVEEPIADVTVGAINAFAEIQELSGHQILKSQFSENDNPIITGLDSDQAGVDLYLSTSSAGGGLQMMVMGVVREMTTESAERAALGAGAIVMDAVSADDGREDHQRIEKIRHVKPDIVLITGGVDGGSRTHVIELAEMLLAAAPRPRFGSTIKLPIIYAGNTDAAAEVSEILAPISEIKVVKNVRPTLEQEELGPARDAIHDFFLEHVMSHSPGFGKLVSWSPVPVMPTPAAVGDIVKAYGTKNGINVLCADIGGATTDLFSLFRDTTGNPIFNRTVSANLGMSYSIANVLVESGAAAIKRWLPYELSDSELRDRLRNKMIRPTSIPQAIEDLVLEQAVCREALRLSLIHHRSLAVGLSGIQHKKGIADIFSQRENRYQLVDMLKLDMVIGSGGVLSHAPNRLSALMMMLDGFGLEGVTQITVDSIFMMPHLGVLSSVHLEAAEEILLRDCLINLGHSIVPIQRTSRVGAGRLAEVYLDDQQIGAVESGQVTQVTLTPGQKGRLRVHPSSRTIDCGAGEGLDEMREIEIG